MVLKKWLTIFLINFRVVLIFLFLLRIFPLINNVWIFTSSYMFPMWNFVDISTELTTNAKIFARVVSFVSAIIYLYSYFYLGTAKDMNTFRSVLIIFVFSMLILVLSGSFLTYILGWDGLGVSSFLLVIYYRSLLATRSGLATFITNRLGDFFIIVSFIFLLGLDTIQLETNTQKFPINYGIFTTLFFFMLLTGAFTKRAQIPFSAWLPAAIAAPTPVSALVHSSTLVTAGLYIISKFLYKLDLTINVSIFFCAATVVLSTLAGLIATVESDLKKLVAMSTLRQIGLIGYILFLKENNIALFHIFSHATFKSLLFIVVGSFIIYNTGFQDIRVKTADLSLVKIPIVFLIARRASLIGFLYSSGFFSKDLIILTFCSSGISLILYFFLLFSCFLTVCYTLKSFKLLLNNIRLAVLDGNKTSSAWLSISAMGLLAFTLIFGYFFFWENIDQEHCVIEATNKLLGLWVIITGMVFRYLVWKKNIKTSLTRQSIKYKQLKIFFIQITNLNWISNNFFSSTFKNRYINFYEPTWWNYISEVVSKKNQLLARNHREIKTRNFILPLEQTLYFLLFAINIIIMLIVYF